jgi:hypothetical protein
LARSRGHRRLPRDLETFALSPLTPRPRRTPSRVNLSVRARVATTHPWVAKRRKTSKNVERRPIDQPNRRAPRFVTRWHAVC